MNLKMPGPNGIITISSDPRNAHEAEVANLEHTKAELASYGDIEVREEVDIDYIKKPCPSSTGPEVRAPPTDPSSSNWQESATKN